MRNIYVNDSKGAFKYKGCPAKKVSLKKEQVLDDDKFYRGFDLGVYELTEDESLEIKIDLDGIPKVNNDIESQLKEIDLKSIRALREGDAVKLKELDDQAKELRKKLK